MKVSVKLPWLNGTKKMVLVVKGSYARVERIFLGMSLVFFGYVISAFMAHPPWREVGRALINPTFSLQPDFLFTFVAIVGTTISPYMQIFVQSSVVDKGVRPENYGLTRADVWVGTVFAILIVFFSDCFDSHNVAPAWRAH